MYSLQGEPGERGEDGLPGKPGLRVWTLPLFPIMLAILSGLFGVLCESQFIISIASVHQPVRGRRPISALKRGRVKGSNQDGTLRLATTEPRPPLGQKAPEEGVVPQNQDMQLEEGALTPMRAVAMGRRTSSVSGLSWQGGGGRN